MGFLSSLSIFILFLFSCSSLTAIAQQPYFGLGLAACSKFNNSNSALGYTCNGLNRTCQSYLTFRAIPPYNSVSTISNLLNSNPSQLSQINSVSKTQTFGTNKLVIVPVSCSCSGKHYQVNTSYTVKGNDNYWLIATSTFQGLSTCQAIKDQNRNLTTKLLYAGQRLNIPLRCACPTKNQTDLGLKYLVSYLVRKNDYVSRISVKLHGDIGRTLQANGLSEDESTIYPDTTLLVPLENPPLGSQIVEPPLPPQTPTSPPPTVSSSTNKNTKSWFYALLGALGGGAFVLIIGMIVFFFVLRKSKKKADPIIVSESVEVVEKLEKKKIGEESEDLLDSLSDIAQSIKVYKFEELKQATNSFNPSCWISGSVYRATIKGDLAAIKEMDGDVSKEINLLQKINHFNLIRLLGVCFNEGHWYLVYEYAANGTLSDWIFPESNINGKFLNWTQRIQIMLDVATGLNYLHSFTTPPHIHKDIKSSNILLDSDFRAKIGNFGLARSAEADEGQFSLTKHIVGTIGYMAPEYLENGLVSTKLDVYAFGILMFEMLTGKEIAELYEENRHLSDILNAVVEDHEDEEQNLRQFMDSSLHGSFSIELAKFVVGLIDGCLKNNAADRPPMDEIVQVLSKTLSNSLTWEMAHNFSAYQYSFRTSDNIETET